MKCQRVDKIMLRRVLFSLIVLCAFVWGCQSSEPLGRAAAVEVVPQITSEGDALYDTLDSVSALTEQATLIVIGTVEKTDHVINMARDVNDINKPDLSYLGLGQLYTVKVESVVKGALASDTVLLAQVEGMLFKPQVDIIPSPEDAEMARKDYRLYIPFTEGRRYLLFLEPLYGFEAERYYGTVPHPNRFDISNPEQIRAESPAAIPGISTLDRLLADIAAVATPTPTAEATIISPLPTPGEGVVTPVPEVTKAP